MEEIQNICRICLVESNEESECVFDTIINSTGEPVKFSEMLMECAKIQIISGDELPDQICSSCAQNTTKLYLFKLKCEESDKTLRNRLKQVPSFVVIDKIDVDEEDILSKVKKENIEQSDDVLKYSEHGHCAQQNQNNPLDTIVYEDFDVYCPLSPKYSDSLNTSFATNNKVSITEEFTSRENDLLHSKKVAEIAHQIKLIDQKLDSQRHEINENKNTAYGEVIAHSPGICLEDGNQISSLNNFNGNRPTTLLSCDKSFESSLKNLVKFVESNNIQNVSHYRNLKCHQPVALTTPNCAGHSLTGNSNNSNVKRPALFTRDKSFNSSSSLKNVNFVDSSSNQNERHYRNLKYSQPVALATPLTQLNCAGYYLTGNSNNSQVKIPALLTRDISFDRSSLQNVVNFVDSNNSQYECHYCNLKFSQPEALARHNCVGHYLTEKKNTSSLVLFECDICKIKLSNAHLLNLHKRTHAVKKKEHICDVCGKKSVGAYSLMLHKRSHTGERPFDCNLCERRFISPVDLKIHKRTHTGEKPYECDVCDKKFYRSTNLNSHRRTHTGEKPYKCDICDKKYGRSGELLMHKRTHTGELRYKCDVCEKKFGRATSLTVHKRMHTGEKPYKCDFCEMRFMRASGLVSHKRAHHKA